MARQALESVIRRSLDFWFEDLDLRSQLTKGNILLSQVKLRRRAISAGCVLDGTIGQISAKWSWSSLLTQPIEVDVNDVQLVLKVCEANEAFDDKKTHTDATEPETASTNFIERLKRRILDRLTINLSNLHIRFQGLVDARCSTTKAGLVLNRFSISSTLPSNLQGLLQQVVILDGVGVYVQPGTCESEAEHPAELTCQSDVGSEHAERDVQIKSPPEEAFVVQGLSPSCRTIRHSGRRFADWIGLEVHVELDEPQLRWTHAQHRELLFLIQTLTSVSKHRGSAEHEESTQSDVFCDCDEFGAHSEPPGESLQQSQKQSWFQWVCSHTFTIKPEPGIELPEDVSDADSKALLEEDSAPAQDASLQLALTIRGASLHAVDSSLNVRVGGMFSMSFRETLSWDGHAVVTEFQVCQLQQFEDGHLQSPVICCTDQDNPHFVVKLKQSTDSLSVSFDVFSHVVEISPAIVRSIQWLVSTYTHLSASQTLFSPTGIVRTKEQDGFVRLLSWDVHSISLKLGAPWISGMCAGVELSSQGTVARGCDGNISLTLTTWSDKQPCMKQLFEPIELRLTMRDGSTFVTCDKIKGTCEVQELVSIIRLAQGISNTAASVCTSNVISTSTRRFDPAKAFEPLFTFVLDVLCVEVLVHDYTIDASTAINISSLELSLGSESFKATSTTNDFQVRMGGQELGLLQVPDVCVSWNILFDAEAKSFKFMIEGGVQIFDPSQSRFAFSCPLIQFMLFSKMGDSRHAVTLDVVFHDVLEIDASDVFLHGCSMTVDYVSDMLSVVFCVQPFLFERRPFGLQVLAGEVLATSGEAALLGVTCGSLLRGMEPASQNMMELFHRPLPVCLLIEQKSLPLLGDIVVHPITLKVSKFSAQRGVELAVEHVRFTFKRLELKQWQGSWEQLSKEVTQSYKDQLAVQLPWLVARLSLGGRSLRDSFVSSFGSSLAMLRYGGCIPAALAGVFATGMVSAASSSIEKGKQLRVGEEAHSAGYRFGDFTRGLLALAREEDRQNHFSFDDRSDRQCSQFARGSLSVVARYTKDNQVASSVVGAVVGGGLLAAAGPVGVSVGMAAGASVGRAVSNSVASSVAKGKQSRGAEESDGYRLGDFSRGLMAAGREARGEDPASDYKFGDFSRGLFSKFKR